MLHPRPRHARRRLSSSIILGIALPATTLAAAVQSQAGRPAASVPLGVTAFVDVAVVPMDTERVLLNQTVVVEGGRIAALGPSKQVKVPVGATTIDGRGQYLIPGLGDCHTHISTVDKAQHDMSDRRRHDLAASHLLGWLAEGVTTIRNVDYLDRRHNRLLDSRELLQLRAQAAAGELWSPRIYTAGQWGPIHYTNAHLNVAFNRGPQDPPPAAAPPPRLDSIAAYVAAYQAAGYDFLKIHDEQLEVFDSVLVAARRVGMPVVGHLPPEALERALAAGGMRSTEHMLFWVGRSAKKGLSDTELQQVAAGLTATVQRSGTWQCVTVSALTLPTWSLEQQKASSNIRRLKAWHDAGVKLLLGSDRAGHGGGGGELLAELYSYSNRNVHRELEVMVLAGLSPYQALVTGTRNMAAYFGTLDSSGTIAVGKRADLVLLPGNPLADIRRVQQLTGVMLGGRWLAREAISARLAALKTAIDAP
jgi:imidazolonepropionase-like amidohydrolase